MRVWPRIALLATACLLLVGLVPAVLIFYRMEMPRRVDLQELAKLTALEFPPGAVMLHSTLQEGTDWSVQAVVEIRAADMGRLLASVKRTYSMYEVTAFESRERGYGHPSWWRPYKSGRFRDFRAVSRVWGFKAQARLRVTRDDPRRSVVYLDWTGKP